MKASLLAIVLSLFFTSASAQGKSEFLSWYNGWGVQTIWGVGAIGGSYTGTTVRCGNELVPVRTVYDTHQASGLRTGKQSKRYLASVNSALIHSFEAAGIKCAFQFIREEP